MTGEGCVRAGRLGPSPGSPEPSRLQLQTLTGFYLHCCLMYTKQGWAIFPAYSIAISNSNSDAACSAPLLPSLLISGEVSCSPLQGVEPADRGHPAEGGPLPEDVRAVRVLLRQGHGPHHHLDGEVSAL